MQLSFSEDYLGTHLDDVSRESQSALVGERQIGLVERSLSAPADCGHAGTWAQSFQSFNRSPDIIFQNS